MLSLDSDPVSQSSGNHVDDSPIFFAVKSRTWPNGLIPIYQSKQKNGGSVLTRRLTHARENFVDPLFFAFPPQNESNTAELSGRWSCEAVHNDGSIDFLHWEMTVEDGVVVGRFDQDTDYRFAWLMEGRFNDPHILLKAEYIDAKYELKGNLTDGKLQGTWKHHEGADGGTWKAEPSETIFTTPDLMVAVTLYVIEDKKSRHQSILVSGKPPANSKPLCKVWLPIKESSDSSTR